MENLENETISIHQEPLNEEPCIRQALRQSGMTRPPFINRTITSLGDMLIRLGTRLKKHASTRLTTEEASTPSFLVVL